MTLHASPSSCSSTKSRSKVSADDAEGKTIEELFSEYGSDLGDVKRITRYVSAGQIVSDDAAVVPGTIYRGAITSESKGLN